MPITAEACFAAVDLLSEREELLPKIEELRAANVCKIDVRKTIPVKEGQEEWEYPVWVIGREITINAAIRKLMLAGIEEELATIDAKLAALGVSPPADTDQATEAA